MLGQRKDEDHHEENADGLITAIFFLISIAGLAYFLYVGSPSSKNDCQESKIGEPMRMTVGEERAGLLIEEIDWHYLRQSGHTKPHRSGDLGHE